MDGGTEGDDEAGDVFVNAECHGLAKGDGNGGGR